MAAATVVVVSGAEVVVGPEAGVVGEVAGVDADIPGPTVATEMLDVVEPAAEVMVGPVPEGVPEPEQPAMAIAISGTAAVETDRDQTPDMAFMRTKTCPSPGRLQLPAHERLQQTRGGTAPGLMRNGGSDHPIVLRGH